MTISPSRVSCLFVFLFHACWLAWLFNFSFGELSLLSPGVALKQDGCLPFVQLELNVSADFSESLGTWAHLHSFRFF